MTTRLVRTDSGEYRIGYSLAALEEVAMRYEYLVSLRQSLFRNPETGEPDLNIRRVMFVADIALRHGGESKPEDVIGGLPDLQALAVAFLDAASGVYEEDAPKKKATARPRKPRSGSET